MSKYFMLLPCVGLLVLTNLSADDQAEMKMLVSRIVKERNALEKTIVQGWPCAIPKKELKVHLTKLLGVVVRLRTFSPEEAEKSLINEIEAKRHVTCQHQAAAMVREFYRRKGLEVDIRKSFRSEYTVYPNKFQR